MKWIRNLAKSVFGSRHGKIVSPCDTDTIEQAEELEQSHHTLRTPSFTGQYTVVKVKRAKTLPSKYSILSQGIHLENATLLVLSRNNEKIKVIFPSIIPKGYFRSLKGQKVRITVRESIDLDPDIIGGLDWQHTERWYLKVLTGPLNEAVFSGIKSWRDDTPPDLIPERKSL